MLCMLGLSTGFQAGPMAIKQTVCVTKPMTMLAGASLGEDAAKRAWLANNPPAYGPNAGKGQAGARRAGPPGAGRSAAAVIAASKSAWNDKNHQVSGKASTLYRASAFGDNSPAVRPMASRVASSEPPMARRSALAPPAVAPPAPAAPAPSAVPYTMVGVGGDEAAAKAAWLAKMEAPKFGPAKGRKAASTRKSSTYRNPSMGDNM